MRIVLDTNVLVSGLISHDLPPSELIEAWKGGRFSLLISPDQLLELQRVLSYERLQRFINPVQARSLIETIVAVAELVDQKLPTVDFSPDPEDNRIIAAALVGDADLIVSGDKTDLVQIEEVDGIAIVTPRQALEKLS